MTLEQQNLSGLLSKQTLFMDKGVWNRIPYAISNTFGFGGHNAVLQTLGE